MSCFFGKALPHQQRYHQHTIYSIAHYRTYKQYTFLGYFHSRAVFGLHAACSIFINPFVLSVRKPRCQAQKDDNSFKARACIETSEFLLSKCLFLQLIESQ